MKQKFTFLLTLLFATVYINAQVTIGSAHKPNTGALLDLKQENDGSSDKGLGLPRVELTKLKPTTPAELSASIGSTGNWDMAAHIGLIIYNVKDAVFNPDICKTEGGPGLYVWDGSTWVGLGVQAAPIDLRTVTDDGSEITLSYNGEVTKYRYSSFGAAGIWMTENLATQYLPDGTQIPKSPEYVFSNIPQYTIPGDNATITGKEGLLYNWYAAMNRYTCKTMNQAHEGAGSTIPGANEVESLEESIAGAKDGKIQGICPTGWHLPSDREWNQLEKEIMTKASLYTQTPMDNGTWDVKWETEKQDRGNNNGTAMKSKDTQVNGMSPNGDSRSAGDGGIDLLLTGSIDNTGATVYGSYAYLWSSSSSEASSAVWLRIVRGGQSKVQRSALGRYTSFSVRCKKN